MCTYHGQGRALREGHAAQAGLRVPSLLAWLWA
jgi:hypothetical protein